MITKHEPAGPRSLPPLSDKHRHAHEIGSAIAPDILDNSGLHTITDGRQLPRGFCRRQRRRTPGVLYVVPRPNGKEAWVFRPDDPDPDNPGLKYEATCKELGGPGNVLYVHPSQRHLIGDTSVPVIFVEGIKKALSIITAARAAGVEVLVVAILGVWNWIAHGKPIPDILDISLEGRGVVNCFDDDIFVNPDVADALRRLAEHEIGRGASAVKVAYLPSSRDGSKTGADDFLARGYGYHDLAATFRPYNPEELATERLKRGEWLQARLEDLRRAFWAAEFKGMGGHSARDVYKVLIDIALGRSKLHADGLRVKISRGELARMAKVSTRTLQKAIERLEEMGLIYRDNDKRKPRERGAFVLRASVNHYRERAAASETTTNGEARVTPGSLHLRAPRLSWSSPARKGRRGVVKGTRRVRLSVATNSRPAIKRLGKIRGAVVDVLDAAGGSAEVAEICETLHRCRARDLRRRVLPMLEEAHIVTVDGDLVSLTDNWLECLEDARELGGEAEAERLQRAHHKRKSEAWRRQEENPPSRHYVNIAGADGHVEELEHIAEALSEADRRILDGIEDFEDKYGCGAFRWDRASCKELFYSSPEGIWPEPEELRRIRDYLTATRGEAA